MPRSNAIAAIFSPDDIAIIGASARRSDSTGNHVIRALRASKYRGRVHVVNPSGGEIEGVAVTPSIAELPRVDVAVIAVNPTRAAGVVDELARAGCRAAIILSIGLQPADLEAIEIARGDMAIHGPNCMGVINVSEGIPLWADDGNLQDLKPGGIALVSQSGSGAIFVARTAASAGFSRIISSGNESFLSTADYLDWLATDPKTSVIGLVVESITDGTAFAAAARRVHGAGKRIVALKVGRSAAGGRATVAHTGAILSDHGTYQSLFASLGIPLVSDYDELATSLELISLLGGRTIDGDRVAVVTISGGQAALAADLAEEAGVELLPFAAATTQALAQIFPGDAINNPLDAAAGLTETSDSFLSALRTLASDRELDAVVVLLDAQQTMSTTETDYEDEYFAAADQVSTEFPDRVVMLVSSSSVSIHGRRTELIERGLPVLRGPKNAMVAIRAASTRGPIATPDRPADLPRPESVAELAELIQSSIESAGAIPSATAHRVLHAYGIPTAASAIVTTPSEAVGWADNHGYPVALKIESPDISHRSDVGGVEVALADPSSLLAGWAKIERRVRAERPSARLLGMEVQTHIAATIEAYLGFSHDQRIDATTIAVGLGGTLVELLGDAQQHVAPVDRRAAAQVLARTRLKRILDGYRSLHPKTSTGPLEDLLVRWSWLATDLAGTLIEGDLNPVFIDDVTGQVRVVDALLVGVPQSSVRRIPNSVIADSTVSI